MSVQRTERNIREYLQAHDVQERILQIMLDARSGATVSISKAADLFHFSENQLRTWANIGRLQGNRSSQTTNGKGRRQFTTEDLDRLALIRDLLDHGFSIDEIPPEDSRYLA